MSSLARTLNDLTGGFPLEASAGVWSYRQLRPGLLQLSLSKAGWFLNPMANKQAMIRSPKSSLTTGDRGKEIMVGSQEREGVPRKGEDEASSCKDGMMMAKGVRSERGEEEWCGPSIVLGQAKSR